MKQDDHLELQPKTMILKPSFLASRPLAALASNGWSLSVDAGSEVVVRGVSESSIVLVTATRQELVAASQDTILWLVPR